MTIYREGKIHYQEFKCGIPQGVLEIIGDSPRKTGTTIEFLLMILFLKLINMILQFFLKDLEKLHI